MAAHRTNELPYRGRVARHTTLRTLALVSAVVLAACESGASGSGEASTRFDPVGQEATPRAPLMPVDLPSRWEVGNRDLEVGFLGRSAREPGRNGRMQSLFMPEDSTADSGPALVVGYVGDDQAEPSYCLGSDRNEIATQGPDFYTSNGAYLFGRGVSQKDLARAAGSVRWGSGVNAPRVWLPARFRLRASSNVPAFGSLPLRAWLHVRAPSGATVVLEQIQSNRAGVTVAKFWRNVLGGRACRDRVQRTVVRDGTVVRLSASDTTEGREAVATVASHLERATPSQFCAGRCAHLPQG
jgi:hypothetical protein